MLDSKMMHWYTCFGLLVLSDLVLSRSAEFDIQGRTSSGWEFVRDAFRENFVKGRDLGGSIAIYHQGELVVDLQGGWFDQTQTKPYDNETLQLVFSTSKGLVATAAALCVQRGLLDYSSLVTQYWPEYGQFGKENTTVADILSHRTGLPNDTVTMDEYVNWPFMIRLLEEMAPEWSPGSAHGYHALTYGWLAGELILRVDPKKRTVGEFIRDEIAIPNDLEFYIGLPAALEPRVSPLDLDAQGMNYAVFNERRVHAAEIPAANGISNARSVAKLYALCLGKIEGRERILTEEILQRAIRSNTPPGEIDLVLQIPSQIAMGFFLFDQAFPSFSPGVFGHLGKARIGLSISISIFVILGLGGSIGFAAPAKQFSFAFVMNRMDSGIAFDVDVRYKSMLESIGKKLSNGHVRLSSSLFLLLISRFITL